MRLLFRTSVGLLILVAALLVLSPPGPAYADCLALTGHGPVASVCHVTVADSPLLVSGSFTVAETLQMDAGSSIVVTPSGQPLVIDITGSFIMNNPSEINGDLGGTSAPASPITIIASANITLHTGAIIHSNNTGGSCNQALNTGGNITLTAGTTGKFIQEDGSKIDSISPCGRGEIIITAQDIDIDGEVLSQATRTGHRGGPITVKALCSLNESDTGTIVSRGLDEGADLVHLEAGCQVTIFGLVASTGPGHKLNSDARCNAPARPGTNNPAADPPALNHPYSTACVEIWAGQNLLNPGLPAILIDSRPPHNGQVHADTAQSGGIAGNGWVDLFARGDIEINGDTIGTPAGLPFAVHANQYRSSGHGGQIRVKSTEGSVSLLGLALQASADKGINGAAVGGGDGGAILVQAKKNVKLDNNAGEIEAAGSPTGSTSHGGHVFIQAFGTVSPDGSIIVTAPFTLDVTGHTPPDGTVDLKACNPVIGPGAITIVPGVVVPTTATVCGGSPPLPIFPAVGIISALPPLPNCAQCFQGKCACVNNFSPALAVGGAQLTINGVGLDHATSVIFATNCDPGSAAANGTVLPAAFTSQAPGTIVLPVPAGLANAPYKLVITDDNNGSCCAPGLFTKTP